MRPSPIAAALFSAFVSSLIVGCGAADDGTTDPASELDAGGSLDPEGSSSTETGGADSVIDPTPDGESVDPTDAGASDSGTKDSGTKDSGTKDPGTKDSGAADSGKTDTGSAPADAGTSTDAGAPTKTPLGKYVMTWYSFQDNTPVNSAFSSSGRKLLPYVSVALPFRMLKPFGGKIAYGDKIHLQFLEGRTMPNGTRHTGWVQVDDFCGDSGDDSYCYQTVGGSKYPNVDLYLGDFTRSGMDNKACGGPAGSGQELTTLSTGTPGSAWIGDYGGRALGSGKCGDAATAKSQQGSCWDYTPPASSASECAYCTTSTCASW